MPDRIEETPIEMRAAALWDSLTVAERRAFLLANGAMIKAESTGDAAPDFRPRRVRADDGTRELHVRRPGFDLWMGVRDPEGLASGLRLAA